MNRKNLIVKKAEVPLIENWKVLVLVSPISTVPYGSLIRGKIGCGCQKCLHAQAGWRTLSNYVRYMSSVTQTHEKIRVAPKW
jgi:hypothetical protein